MKKRLMGVILSTLIAMGAMPVSVASPDDGVIYIVPPVLEYDKVYPFSEDLARIRKGDEYGFIDKSGKEVIPSVYDEARPFEEGLARVYKDGKWGFIDKTGKVVILSLIYDEVLTFSEGLARVKKGGKYGYIDKTGKMVIPLSYYLADSFSEGLAFVGKGDWGKWIYGFIDKTGKEIIPLIYQSASDFSEGVAPVLKDGKWGIIANPLTAIKVVLNGEQLKFDRLPITENGRTLVPLRVIFEAMGATVDWDGVTQTVTAVKGNTTVKMQIGNSIMIKNGEKIALDVPPKIINGRTLVPVRAVAESFGAKVDWDGETKTVIITD